MALQTFLDAFNVTTGAVNTTYARSGYGFQPKALFVWATRLNGTVDEVSGAIDGGISLGLAVSASARRNVTSYLDDTAASSSAKAQGRVNDVLHVYNTSGTTDGVLDISSIDSDGVTFIVDDQFADTYRVFALAIGGSDLTNTAVGTITQSTGVASQDVTDVGFQPDCVLFITNQGITIGAALGIGACDTALNNAVLYGRSRDAQANMSTSSYCRSGDAIATLVANGGFDSRSRVSAWLSNGFTLTYDDQAGTAGTVYYLALKGGQFSIKTGTTQTDTTTDIAISSVGFQPTGGLVFSACRAQSSAGTGTNHQMLSVGAFTSASAERGMALWDENSAANDECAQAQENDACYINIDSGDAVQGIMHVQSVDADGVTFRMADADPSGSFFWTLLFGSSASGVTGTSSVTIGVTGSVTGSVLVQGAVSAAIPVTGSAAGSVAIAGESSKQVGVTGSATGAVLVQGASSQPIGIAGNADGQVLVQATSTVLVPIGGAAAGVIGSQPAIGDSTVSIPVAGAAAGVVLVQAESSRTLSIGGSIVGTVLIQGESIVQIPIGGIAEGSGPVSRSLLGPFTVILRPVVVYNVTPPVEVRDIRPPVMPRLHRPES